MKARLLVLILFLAIGVLAIGVGAWQIYDSSKQAKSTTEKVKKDAKAIIQGVQKDSPTSFTPSMGDTIGLLEIPRLSDELGIVEGTEPDDLKKGVGHFKDSFYPNENGQIVLSGHRDTVFRRLGELKIGDLLKIKMPYGDYSYKIVKTKIVDADDRSIITLQNDKEELLITTCYPFGYVGNAPKRYIVYALRK